MTSVFCMSLFGSDSKMRISTIGGGSTGRRSAAAIQPPLSQLVFLCTVKRKMAREKKKKGHTLRTGTASSGALWLLHHPERVGDLLTLAGDPRRRVLRLIWRM